MAARLAASTPAGAVTILEPGPADTLDPLLTRTAAGADATAGVFDSLVRFDASGTARPDLASRWFRSVDARTWTFVLDSRARWQDGEPVTADDVAFTTRLVRDARFGATTTRGYGGITSVVISATNIVTVTLRAAFAPFLAFYGTTPILPAHVLNGIAPADLRSYAPFNRHPIGTGPFIVSAFSRDGRVIEQANPDYFRGAPRLDRLIIAPANSRQSALNQARNDAGTLLPPSLDLNTTESDVLAGSGLSRIVYDRTFAWTHLDLIEHGALADSRVRRALALATPRDQIIRQVLHGHGQLSDGDQAPGTAVYEPAVKNFYHFDLPAARRLLALAGYGPATRKAGKAGQVNVKAMAGVTLTINLWADSSCVFCAPTLGLIARSWAQAGISSRIHLVHTGFLFGPSGPLYNPGRFHAPDYNAVLYAWVNGPDPDDSTYWSQSAIVTPTNLLAGNFGGYHNAAVDYLATRALVTPNGPSRFSYYRRIQRILAADEPDIFLYWADSLSIVPRKLVGYSVNRYNPAATWNAASWYLTG